LGDGRAPLIWLHGTACARYAGAFTAANALQCNGMQPVTMGLVAAQTALHLRPGGYRMLQVLPGSLGAQPHPRQSCCADFSSACPHPLRAALPLQVGLNSHRVLHHGEWRRLGSSLVLHRDLPHLVSNCTALLTDGLPLERRLGATRFAALVASSAALTQGLHCEPPALSSALARLIGDEGSSYAS
jgi:hypothetical protein